VSGKLTLDNSEFVEREICHFHSIDELSICNYIATPVTVTKVFAKKN
jgi:hypothetical protein